MSTRRDRLGSPGTQDAAALWQLRGVYGFLQSSPRSQSSQEGVPLTRQSFSQQHNWSLRQADSAMSDVST